MNKTAKILASIALILALALSLGAHFVFHACGPMEDGSYMHCHQAEQTVVILGMAAAVTALAVLLLKQKAANLAAWIALVLEALAALLTPGTLVSLCGMDTMRCQAVFRPSVTVISVLLMLVSLLGFVVSWKAFRK